MTRESKKMAEIQIHAGDFTTGKGSISVSANSFGLTQAWAPGDGFLGKADGFTKSDVEDVSIATEENVKKIGGTVGWGVVGATLLGPVGLLAGLLMGGRGKQVTFILKLKDGRKMLATTDSKTFTKLAALAF